MKKLRRIAGGDTYTIIYLKLQLLSLKDEGLLFYEGIEPTFYEEMALALDEDAENVENTIETLIDMGLAQFSDKNTLRVFKVQDTRNRQTKEYKKWRQSVFIRDDFTCQICGERGGHLEAHHKKAWAYYPSERYDIDNGITLCKICHKKIHKGVKDNGRT
jgi:predicted phage replisome organizer